MDALSAEAIRTMYAQARTTLFAGAVITIYMVGVSLPFTPWPIVFGWAVAPIALLVIREISVRHFRRANPTDAVMKRWAIGFAIQQAAVGVVWGATMFLFVHAGQPISVALTLCCLYSIAAGSVSSLAYYPPANIAMVVIMYSMILLRMISYATTGYELVGVASALFGVTMIGYCRVQARTVQEGLRIRFENRELVAALAVEKADAEEARYKAELASLAKSQFLAAASHDLRQPLYALSLFSASLDELKLDAEGRGVVGNIQDSIGVMESLFDGLLDISKLEAGVVKPRIASVSIDTIFDRISQVFRPIAIERGLELRFRSDDEWVRSDAILLEQVLSNFVSNALRNTRTGGVLLAARRRDASLSIEVWDTGRGIDPADRDRIFDEFVQLDNPERDRSKGLGLGLSIARRAAALIDAPIALVSRPGLGSCFAVRQPIGAAPVELPAVESGAGQGALEAIPRDRSLPILIIDDDRDVRAALGNLLSRWAVAFEAFGDAESALAAIDAGQRYGLVLADYRLGGPMSGLDLLVAIEHHHPSPAPARVLITGDFDAALMSTAHAHAVPVLHKPVRGRDLHALLGLKAVPAGA